MNTAKENRPRTVSTGLTGICFVVYAFLSLHHPTAALPFAVTGYLLSRGGQR